MRDPSQKALLNFCINYNRNLLKKWLPETGWQTYSSSIFCTEKKNNDKMQTNRTDFHFPVVSLGLWELKIKDINFNYKPVCSKKLGCLSKVI